MIFLAAMSPLWLSASARSPLQGCDTPRPTGTLVMTPLTTANLRAEGRIDTSSVNTMPCTSVPGTGATCVDRERGGPAATEGARSTRALRAASRPSTLRRAALADTHAAGGRELRSEIYALEAADVRAANTGALLPC